MVDIGIVADVSPSLSCWAILLHVKHNYHVICYNWLRNKKQIRTQLSHYLDIFKIVTTVDLPRQNGYIYIYK